MRLFSSWRQLRFRARQRRRASTDSKVVLEGPEPPNGFLFNEKPLLPGERRVKEWWENLWVYGMGFNMLLLMAVGILKPDTSVSSWARVKAEERLARKEGALTQAGGGGGGDGTMDPQNTAEITPSTT